MQEATFTELRNHAKSYFDAVEAGDTIRIYRKGKAIAQIVPIDVQPPSWKNHAQPILVKGVSLSRSILLDRESSV